MKHQRIREICCEANRQLPETGLVDLTFGNVSVLDPEEKVFAIKPSGVNYAELTPESMVLMDLAGKQVAGSLRPSSDTPTHLRLYQEWSGVGVAAIVHTHSRNAVAFAQAARSLPCLGTTHCDYFKGEVPVTRAMTKEEIEGDYERETAEVILESFSGLNPSLVPAVLVRNHGPFTWGESAAKAVENAQALEIVANMAFKALSLNAVAEDVSEALQQKHFSRKHGDGAYYGQNPS